MADDFMRMIFTIKIVSVFQDLEIKRKKHSLFNDMSFEHLEHIRDDDDMDPHWQT